MWKKPDNEFETDAPEPRPVTRERGDADTGGAIIGASISIEGELKGDEDLTIHGRIKGNITLPEHTLKVGQDGRVEATIRARSIVVDGHVRGDLIAQEQIMIRRSGDVHGNIIASRVGLEDGAKFKGSIDMEAKSELKRETPKSVKTNTDISGAAQSKAHA